MITYTKICQNVRSYSYFLSVVTLWNFFFFLNIYSDKIVWEALDPRPGSVTCCLWAVGKPSDKSVTNRPALFVHIQMKQSLGEPFEPNKIMKMTNFSSTRLEPGLPSPTRISLLEASSHRTRKQGHFLRTSSRASPYNIWGSFFGEVARPGEQLLLGALMNKWP